jgi:hypothetical protein
VLISLFCYTIRCFFLSNREGRRSEKETVVRGRVGHLLVRRSQSIFIGVDGVWCGVARSERAAVSTRIFVAEKRIGHWPATAAFLGTDRLLLVRGVLLNMIGGLWFGYLYWRYGLEYAVVAQMSADIILHVI